MKGDIDWCNLSNNDTGKFSPVQNQLRNIWRSVIVWLGNTKSIIKPTQKQYPTGWEGIIDFQTFSLKWWLAFRAIPMLDCLYLHLFYWWYSSKIVASFWTVIVQLCGTLKKETMHRNYLQDDINHWTKYELSKWFDCMKHSWRINL